MVLAEGVAQNLEVVQVGIVGGCVKLDTSHGHIDWRDESQLGGKTAEEVRRKLRKMLS